MPTNTTPSPEPDPPRGTPERPLTVGEAAKICRVPSVTLRLWVRQGKIRSFSTPGGHHRIEPAELQRFMQEHGMTPPPAVPRVLVVDDDSTYTTLFARVLRRAGYEVLTSNDGYEACILLGQHVPGLVVLDLIMPRVDGFEICRRIRSTAATAATRVLAITGDPTPEHLDRIRRAGADTVLQKPVDLAAFRAEVRRLLPV